MNVVCCSSIGWRYRNRIDPRRPCHVRIDNRSSIFVARRRIQRTFAPRFFLFPPAFFVGRFLIPLPPFVSRNSLKVSGNLTGLGGMKKRLLSMMSSIFRRLLPPLVGLRSAARADWGPRLRERLDDSVRTSSRTSSAPRSLYKRTINATLPVTVWSSLIESKPKLYK